jgi:glycosyltransferase involved in cell wall biosynthesis
MAERGERPPYLVFAGLVGWLVADLLALIENDPLLKGRIVMLTRATDAELSWLYRNALFTVYPSFYEGWGLPISESLAQGKACIASNSSAMPEAGQGLAIHLDPQDFAAWYREIRSLIEDRPRLAALEAEIKRRYRRLDWSEAAERFAAELARFAAGRG